MTSKMFTFLVFGVLTLGVLLGFTNSNDNPQGSKSNTPFSVDNTIYPPAISSNATVIYVDSLNGNNDTTALKSRGYFVWYRGAGPQGLTATWFQGGVNWNAFNGPPTGYVHANYNVVTGTNNIDSWMISPPLDIMAGDSLMFWERSVAANPFPDSMRIMYSATGSTTPEGTWVELGRFLNSTGDQWVQRKYRLPAAGSTGRFALRYSVVAGGPTGDNSNLIGVDMITVTRGDVTPGVCNYIYTPQTSGITNTIYSISAVSDMVGWAGGAAGLVRRTTDGGTSWTNGNPTPGVISGDIYNIYAWSANDALCTTSPSAANIYKTTNGGTTWTQVYTLAGGFINAIQMLNTTEGYATGDPVGGKWTILKTTDGGSSWARMATEPVQVGAEAGWNNSFQVMGTHIWFGTNATKVYHSSDLGVTWASGVATGSVNTYALHYNSATNGLAGGTAMVKSVDGGTTYTAATTPGLSGNVSGITGVGTNWWSVRTGTDIYRSTDQGTTWTVGNTVTGAAYNDIGVADNSGCASGWAVGTGTITKIKGTTVGINSYSSEIPESFYMQQNYPNPFNPTTNISFSIPTSGFVTLKVYNMAGMEVAKLLSENKTAGSYTIGFNAANLPSGAYFYRLETNSFADTKKMILIK
jgi:hypothetical protein